MGSYRRVGLIPSGEKEWGESVLWEGTFTIFVWSTILSEPDHRVQKWSCSIGDWGWRLLGGKSSIGARIGKKEIRACWYKSIKVMRLVIIIILEHNQSKKLFQMKAHFNNNRKIIMMPLQSLMLHWICLIRSRKAVHCCRKVEIRTYGKSDSWWAKSKWNLHL